MVMGELSIETELLVIGGGPAGYAAAFRAADLGLDVTLVELGQAPGGVCLFRGCIPSKTYLHLAQLIEDARHADAMGIRFEPPDIDVRGLRDWKQQVVARLSRGLASLCRQRNVQLIRGRAVFEDSRRVRLMESEIRRIQFQHAILATGSRPVTLPDVPVRKNGRVMTSTGALELADIPRTLLVIGGGYVGLELGSVYAALGSRVTVVEQSGRLLAGADVDLVEPLRRRLEKIFARILLKTAVSSLQESPHNVKVTLKGRDGTLQETFERVLIAVGRTPNSRGLGLEHTGVARNARGFVIVDAGQRTGDEHILAAGDITGGMLLAHKATREGKVAAEVIAGKPSAFDVRAMPAVVYTNPQIAWCGLTEEAARAQKRAVSVQRFPWRFSGRALSMDAADGLTKIIADPDNGRILGVGIVGRETEGLIAEGVLAVEMGALAEDLALVIHAHPTLSETEGEAAEIFLGSATHILPSKRKA